MCGLKGMLNEKIKLIHLTSNTTSTANPAIHGVLSIHRSIPIGSRNVANLSHPVSCVL